MAQGLHFHPTAFPLGGCLGRGRWEALSGAVESDGIEGEGGCSQKPVPQSPGSSRLWVQLFPNHFCSAPSWEVSQQLVTFLHLPSLLPSSEQAWQMFQGSWIRDEQSKQGMSLSTVSIREWGKERGRKEESLTADSKILWLKVSLIGFPHPVESRQIT